MKVSKTYRLEEAVIEMVENVAKSEFSGNYTAAIESMLVQAFRMRKVDQRDREAMYSAWSVTSKSNNPSEAKNVIDGLNI